MTCLEFGKPMILAQKATRIQPKIQHNPHNPCFQLNLSKKNIAQKLSFKSGRWCKPQFIWHLWNRQISLLKKLLISTEDTHEPCFIWSFQRKNFTCLEALQSAQDTNPSIVWSCVKSPYQVPYLQHLSLFVLKWHPIVSFSFMPDLKIMPFHVQHYMLWERLKRGRFR